jgi:hypothetical protein
MRRHLAGLIMLLAFPVAAVAQEADKSPAKTALESDPEGWVDLMPGKDLSGWKRVAIAPDKELSAKNAWSVKDGLLVCDGVGIKEMFLYDQELGDGVFHIEWRFKKLEGKQDYNSGAYVRTLDGKVWHQVQIAHLEKPPFMGDLFGDKWVDGKPERYIVRGEGDKHAKSPGEWNTHEITMKGKTIEVAINGAKALSWNDCQVPKGRVGLQAEFFYIEFRNLKFKPAK